MQEATDSTRPPEAELIRNIREQFFSGTPMSIREAARRAGISDGTWRRIESDANIERKASTVAAMASVLGILPAHLGAAGRPDAAALLDRLTAARADGAGIPRPTSHDGDSEYQVLMAEILTGLAAIDAEPGLTPRVRRQLRDEFLTDLRREAGAFQRHLRLLRDRDTNDGTSSA